MAELNTVEAEHAKLIFLDEVRTNLVNRVDPFVGAYLPQNTDRKKTFYDTVDYEEDVLEEYDNPYGSYVAGQLATGQRQITWAKFAKAYGISLDEQMETQRDYISNIAEQFVIGGANKRRSKFITAFEATVQGNASGAAGNDGASGPFTFNTAHIASGGQVLDWETYGSIIGMDHITGVLQATIDLKWPEGAPIFWLIGSTDYGNMWEIPEFINRFYRQRAEMDEMVAMKRRFTAFGMNFIVVEDAALAADSSDSTIKFNYAWFPGAMIGAQIPGKKMDVKVFDTSDQTIGNDTQVLKVNDWFGFDRRHDTGVLRIEMNR